MRRRGREAGQQHNGAGPVMGHVQPAINTHTMLRLATDHLPQPPPTTLVLTPFRGGIRNGVLGASTHSHTDRHVALTAHGFSGGRGCCVQMGPISA